VERGLTVVGVVLTVALMLCCCGRAAGREKALYYLPDLIVAAAGLIFVSVAVVFGHKSKALAEGNYQEIPYDVLCSVTTAITVLFVPTIIRRYRWTIRCDSFLLAAVCFPDETRAFAKIDSEQMRGS